MRKCKFGIFTVNCKEPKRCADFKVIGCGLAVSEKDYIKNQNGGTANEDGQGSK